MPKQVNRVLLIVSISLMAIDISSKYSSMSLQGADFSEGICRISSGQAHKNQSCFH
jgi:hypothetical protein